MPRYGIRTRTAAQAFEEGKKILYKTFYSHNRPPSLAGGMDCSGFIEYIFGITENLSTAYMIDGNVMERAQFTRHAIGSTPLRPGDVLCYKDSPMGHTTFYIGNKAHNGYTIMHSTTSSRGNGPQWGIGTGGPMTTIFRPKEGWGAQVPIKWTAG